MIYTRSNIHKGTAELWIEDNGELFDDYYAGRKTTGSMSLFMLVEEDS